MRVLAIDFSSKQRSVAVVCGGPGETPSVTAEAVETSGGGTRAFEMIRAVLRDANLEREQIERIAVGLGPGSYTGIRVALAIGQGWQLARKGGALELLGISSVECLAAEAQANGMRGRIHVVIDAQRNEFYRATYELSATGWKDVEPLRIQNREEIEAMVGTEILIGPEVARWFPKGCLLYPLASRLGQLALSRTDSVPASMLAPIYLREVKFVKAPPPRSPGI